MALFNAGRYFECHEVIEDHLWRPLPPGQEKDFHQGVLQIAVGLHHLRQQNLTGARHLLERGLNRLRPLRETPPFCHWLDLPRFLDDAEELLAALRRPGSQLPGFFRMVLKN